MIKRIIFFSLLAVVLASCGGSKKATSRKKAVVRPSNTVIAPENKNTPAEQSIETKSAAETRPVSNVEAYILAYAEIAQEEMRTYKIPASITLAQAILESGAGRGELTQKANNHFGIKCHEWTGAHVFHDDDARGECFRKYDDPMNSFRDHSEFLTGRRRYANLFTLDPDDYKGWARGLRKAGYATDRKYPEKLIALIERYNLSQYDAEVLNQKPRVYNQVDDYSAVAGRKHKVKKGDTLYNIARRYNLSVNELKRYNSLDDNTIYLDQELLIEPKK